MNRAVFLIGDVYTGNEVLRITGASESEMRKELTSPRWKFVSEGSSDCPDWLERQKSTIHSTEWENKSEYLRRLIFLDRMDREGKQLFPVEGRLPNGSVIRRQVWARSKKELLKKHPSLKFLYYLPITMGEWKAMGESDIDKDDDFVGKVVSRRSWWQFW